MLLRERPRPFLCIFLVPFITFVYFVLRVHLSRLVQPTYVSSGSILLSAHEGNITFSHFFLSIIQSDTQGPYNEIFSYTTPNLEFFRILVGNQHTINPNIIPHPTIKDTWVIVAQEHSANGSPILHSEIACNAVFTTFEYSPTTVDEDNDESTSKYLREGRNRVRKAHGGEVVLSCSNLPVVLAVMPTQGGHCTGEIEYFNMNIGPHDARVFYGSSRRDREYQDGHAKAQENMNVPQPYIIFGSNSQFTCFGQWIQDFHTLFPSDAMDTSPLISTQDEDDERLRFRSGTELQRPPMSQYQAVEKNWFLFWDRSGNTYVHYSMYPTRSFAALEDNASGSASFLPGSPGQLTVAASEIGGISREHADEDHTCFQRHILNFSRSSTIDSSLNGIHQTTNSLAVTLHRRADAKPNWARNQGTDDLTVILSIVHHKTFSVTETNGFRAMYEPYVLAFRQEAPFKLFGISRKPLWIHGRGGRETWAGNNSELRTENIEDADSGMGNNTQMLYVTSVAWKDRNLRYHGYLDDVLFLSFGIDDRESGGIDVMAGDLFRGLGLC